MLYLTPPTNFHSRIHVVGCFLEHHGKFLLLLRQGHKSHGNTYGVPAGKVDDGETPDEAMVRELFEETGYVCKKETPRLFKKTFVEEGENQIIYSIYHLSLPAEHAVIINPEEHADFRWTTPAEALSGLRGQLIHDLDACIELFYFS